MVLWWLNAPGQLTPDVREVIADPANEAFVSAASVWEAAIKVAAGRLTTPTAMVEEASAAGFLELPVVWKHAADAAALPMLHRDPFDRMLIAQALAEGLLLVTRDRAVQQYDVPTMPA